MSSTNKSLRDQLLEKGMSETEISKIIKQPYKHSQIVAVVKNDK